MSKAQLRQLTFLLIFAILGVAGFQYGSVYLVALEYDDFIEQQVKFAARSRRSMEDLRGNVVDKGKEYGLDIHSRDVQISRKGPSFTLNLTYTRPVEMFFYRHNLEFNVSTSGEMFDP